ncbi:hypothetical protein B0H11DRAFT_2294558 [Mycena galericulata]|nr:hypothetical protein B0H11DRAFT_2294558 [Mycena galericulata]
MSDDAPSSSPAYSALLKTLLAKTKKITPLSPSASPGTKKKRAEDYQTVAEISSIIESNRKQEQAAADEPKSRPSTLSSLDSKLSFLLNLSTFPCSPLVTFKTFSSPRPLTSLPNEKMPPFVASLQDSSIRKKHGHGRPLSTSLSPTQLEQQSLSLQPALDKGVQFVDYVLRTIELLKFIRLWTSRDEDRKWKSTYLDNACRIDNEPLYLEREAASPGTPARAALDSQIEQLGPGLFLDPTWDAVGVSASKAPKRSTKFYALSTYLCDHLPEVEIADSSGSTLPYPVTTYTQNADSLYRVLWILSGSREVPDYVQQFLTDFPPKEYDRVWNWGLCEE